MSRLEPERQSVLNRRAFGRSLLLLAVPMPAAAAIPTIGKPRGRPRIKIDQLNFPGKLSGAEEYIRHLKFTLRREARRVDWGAGRESTISFRFTVEELTLTQRKGVLEVRCSARGELPRGRRARSQLVYGGDPQKARDLVRRVLEIVARGVIARLADLERSRRTPST